MTESNFRILGQIGFYLGTAWLIKKVIGIVITRWWSRDGEAPQFLSDLTGVILFIAATFGIIAFVLDKPITGLLATSGLVVAILGLALQSTFSNIFS